MGLGLGQEEELGQEEQEEAQVGRGAAESVESVESAGTGVGVESAGLAENRRGGRLGT